MSTARICSTRSLRLPARVSAQHGLFHSNEFVLAATLAVGSNSPRHDGLPTVGLASAAEELLTRRSRTLPAPHRAPDDFRGRRHCDMPHPKLRQRADE